MKVRVLDKQYVADDICRFEFGADAATMLPVFSAGAHIDVTAPNGMIRQYSLCNAPAERHRYVVAILRDNLSRGGSVAMHEIATGDIVEISEPKNHFPLVTDTTHAVLVAGGIGITPILCMARTLKAANASFELHYSARELSRMAFRRDLEEEFPDEVNLYLDTDIPERRLDLRRALGSPNPGKHLYICGPAGLIEATLKVASESGWQTENVHREFFGNTQSGATNALAFTVSVRSTGAVVEVGASESIVQALTRIGIEIPVSCEQGVCGTCLTRVVAGTPDHRDAYLMDDEKAANNQILPCCSRAKSEKLVLDL